MMDSVFLFTEKYGDCEIFYDWDLDTRGALRIWFHPVLSCTKDDPPSLGELVIDYMRDIQNPAAAFAKGWRHITGVAENQVKARLRGNPGRKQ